MKGCTPEPGAPGSAAQDRAESTPAIPRDLIITPLSHSAGVAVPSREIPPDWAQDAGRRGKPRRAAPLRGSRVPSAGFLARWVFCALGFPRSARSRVRARASGPVRRDGNVYSVTGRSGLPPGQTAYNTARLHNTHCFQAGPPTIPPSKRRLAFHLKHWKSSTWDRSTVHE